MVINCCVYNGDEGDPLNIANVIIDDKFEIWDVYKGEIAIIEFLVRILLRLL